jgi:hypothetical protein
MALRRRLSAGLPLSNNIEFDPIKNEPGQMPQARKK